MLTVIETFYSIEGEGPLIGIPTYFIRLSGCNLRCTWCDTKYSYSGGEKRTVDSLLEEATTYKTKFVCITGGEPLLQKEVYPLMYKLLDKEFKVILETSGSIPIEDVPTDDNMIISMDIKTPS